MVWKSDSPKDHYFNNRIKSSITVPDCKQGGGGDDGLYD